MDAKRSELAPIVNEDLETKYDNALYTTAGCSANQDRVSSQVPESGESSLVHSEAAQQAIQSSSAPKLDVVVERECEESCEGKAARSQLFEEAQQRDSLSGGGGPGDEDARNRTQASLGHRFAPWVANMCM